MPPEQPLKPVIMHERDAIVKVTLASICSSDLHIKHGSVPRAVPGITVGHEMVGIVEEVGDAVTHVKPGDRVTVNVETFCLIPDLRTVHAHTQPDRHRYDTQEPIRHSDPYSY